MVNVYLWSALTFFVLSIAMSVYEMWYVWFTSRNWLYSIGEWFQVLFVSAIIAIIPFYNIFGIVFVLFYFYIEHLPYIRSNK